jgi:hypothetical protein
MGKSSKMVRHVGFSADFPASLWVDVKCPSFRQVVANFLASATPRLEKNVMGDPQVTMVVSIPQWFLHNFGWFGDSPFEETSIILVLFHWNWMCVLRSANPSGKMRQ